MFVDYCLVACGSYPQENVFFLFMEDEKNLSVLKEKVHWFFIQNLEFVLSFDLSS